MNLLPPLLKIAEGIAVDLTEDKQEDFLETVKQTAEGKNLSHVHWAFLGSELRALPGDLSEHIQTLVDKVIDGMDRLAAGEQWHDAARVTTMALAAAISEANAIASVTDNTDAAFATYAAYSVAVAANAIVVTHAVANAAYVTSYAKDNAGYFKARQRQRDTLLALINNAP